MKRMPPHASETNPMKPEIVPTGPGTGAKMKAAKCKAIIIQPVNHNVETDA
jgi:hypothetical protein